MTETRACPVCGKLTVFTSKKKIYCSQACFEKYRQEYMREKQKESRQRKRAARTRKPIAIEEVIRRAEAEHLSYGQYVAKYENFSSQ